MTIEISKFCGKIFLDSLDNQGIYASVLVLSQGGIEKSFVMDPTDLSIKGCYIADEDSD